MREGADFHVWTEMSQGRGRRLVDWCSSCSIHSSQQQQAPPQAALRQASTSYLTHAETSFGSCKQIQPVTVNTIRLSQEFFLYSTPVFLKCLPRNWRTSGFLSTPVLKNRKPSHKQFIRNERFLHDSLIIPIMTVLSFKSVMGTNSSLSNLSMCCKIFGFGINRLNKKEYPQFWLSRWDQDDICCRSNAQWCFGVGPPVSQTWVTFFIAFHCVAHGSRVRTAAGLDWIVLDNFHRIWFL